MSSASSTAKTVCGFSIIAIRVRIIQKTKTHYYQDSQGETKTTMQTVWTEKGRMFIHDFFKHKKAVDKL